MRPLSLEDALGAAVNVGLPVCLTDEQWGQVFSLWAGHPLALVYLLDALQQAAGPMEAQLTRQDRAVWGDITARYDDARGQA